MPKACVSLRWRSSALLVALLILVAPLARAGADDERWYVVTLQGQKAGWMHEKEDESAGGVRSRSEMRLGVGRADAKIEITILTEFLETKDGKPLRMRSEQRLGSMPVVTEFVWGANGVEVTEKQGDRETKRTEPWPPVVAAGESEVLSPGAAERFVEEKMKAGEREIVVRTIDPMGGLTPVTVKRVRKDELGDKTEAFGKVVPARAWGVTQSMTPGVESVDWLDDAGRLVRGDTNMGAFTLTMLSAEKEIALIPSDGPELMASTMIHPNKVIERPREAKKAVYVVRVREGELPELPTTSVQVFERIDAKSGRVRVGARRGPDGKLLGGEAEPTPDTTRPSVMLNSADPAILRLVEKARGEHGLDPMRLRKFVYQYIEHKSLDIGFATASEVARTKQGDCTEHAVLLSALARAGGLPSRCDSGVVYVNEFAGSKGVFGFHMWSEVWEGATDEPAMWMPLDATLDAQFSFDATHIALTVSALGDNDRVNALAAMAPLIGRLEIEVESVEY